MKNFFTIALMLCFTGMMQAQTERGKLILAQAEAGDAKAQNDISYYYKTGKEGFLKNDAKYIYWLRKSAESGYTDSQSDLGFLYEWGMHGVQKDSTEYLKWTVKAANNGHESAYFSLGLYYKDKDRDKAIYWLKKYLDTKSKYGDYQTEELLNELGVVYKPTNPPTGLAPKDLQNAKEGSAWAQYKVSQYYKDGNENYPKDESMMMYWLRKAAENGKAEAQHELGYYYEWGEHGVQKDSTEYLKWTVKAAEKGYGPAYHSLGLYYKDKDKNKAIYYFKRGMDLHYKEYGEINKYEDEGLKELGVNYNPTNSIASNTSSKKTNKINSSTQTRRTTTASNSVSTAQTGQKPQKSWRVNRLDGGYEDWAEYPDGSCFVVTVTPCAWCHGTKVCNICHGQGGTMGRAYGGMWYTCRSCAGSRICQNCHGKGTTMLTTTIANGVATGFDQNGNMYSGGNGGSSSSSSSKKSSSRSKNDKDAWYNQGVDVIEYAPNYTGSDEKYWCEKCQEWGFRHVHIKKK